jgi:hypothetical protein
MDSVIAWYYLGQPDCIYFDTGTVYAGKEYHAILNLGIPCEVDKSLDFSRNSGIYIPHRNLLFASRASQYGQNVIIAGLKDDMVEDKTEWAFDVMSYCLTAIGRETILVSSPFWEMTKSDICRWFLNNVPFAENILRKSISCYNGSGIAACNHCESCFRKACALFDNGISVPFFNDKMIHEYQAKAVHGHYDPERNKSIINFCEAQWRKKSYTTKNGIN